MAAEDRTPTDRDWSTEQLPATPQRDFLIESGAAVLCDPDDPRGSAETLRRFVTDGVSLQLNHDYVNRFSRRETAKRMADIIRGVAVGSRRNRHLPYCAGGTRDSTN